MKKFFIYAVLAFATLSSFKKDIVVKSIWIKTTWPFAYTNASNQTLKYADLDTKIYEVGDDILYQFPEHQDDKDNKIKNTSPLLLLKKGDSTGIYLSKFGNKEFIRIVKADSTLRTHLLGNGKLTSPDTAFYNLTTVVNNNELTQLYISKQDYGEKNYDTIKFQFKDRFKDFPFSLSKTLDSSTALKLYKTTFIFKAKKNTANVKSELIPKRIIQLTLKDNPMSEQEIAEVLKKIDYLKKNLSH